jgi:hypothetical protein
MEYGSTINLTGLNMTRKISHVETSAEKVACYLPWTEEIENDNAVKYN